MDWKKIRVLVAGGASFIGSHLVTALVAKEATVSVADNLSSGKIENIAKHIAQGKINFIQGDLLQPQFVHKLVKNIDIVFHLAAIHGGRGFIDTHSVECTRNLLMDSLLIQKAYEAKVKKFIFTSSGCVYPNYLQKNPAEHICLSENMVGPPYDPDTTYGWAKLTTEKTLQAYARENKLNSVSCRLFSVYGPGERENHAIIGLIAKAFIKQNPYEIWGNGNQIRNWTFVTDIVDGLLKSAEKINDGKAVNLGTMERVRVIDAVREIFHYTNFHPRIVFKPDKPTGPYNRVCDNNLAQKVLSWKPKVTFINGLHKTIDWYFTSNTVSDIRNRLPRLLVD